MISDAIDSSGRMCRLLWDVAGRLTMLHQALLSSGGKLVILSTGGVALLILSGVGVLMWTLPSTGSSYRSGHGARKRFFAAAAAAADQKNRHRVLQVVQALHSAKQLRCTCNLPGHCPELVSAWLEVQDPPLHNFMRFTCQASGFSKLTLIMMLLHVAAETVHHVHVRPFGIFGGSNVLNSF